MALQYIKPSQDTTNPLNERQLSFQDAQDLGYILPLDVGIQDTAYKNLLSQASSGPKSETFWKSLFDAGINSATYYKTAIEGGSTGYTNTQYNNAIAVLNAVPSYINKRTEEIKTETARDIGRSKATMQRLARSSGGLLSGSSAPTLDGGKGLPELGKSSPVLSTSTNKIGTKAKI